MIRFIQNVGEFFASNYFDEDFSKKVHDKSGYDRETIKEIDRKIKPIKDKYYSLKQDFLEEKLRVKDEINRTHEFHTKLLNILGYQGDRTEYDDLYPLSEEEVIPVRHTLYRGDEPQLMILEMQAQIKTGEDEPDGLFEQRYNTPENGEVEVKEQRYHRSQWKDVFSVPEGLKLSPTIINNVISELFMLEEHRRPDFILLLAANKVYLLESEKWFKGAYLEFDLEELFDEATANKKEYYYATLKFLVGKESLAPEGKQILLEELDEDSHKSAYEVTKDLKEGVIHAVEAIANEALDYLKDEKGFQIDEYESDFAQEIRDDCLTIIYRLLFIFYAESREELSILPVNDSVYQKGYSMEMLRDLEQVPLNSETARNGYFFHESLTHLFDLMSSGYKEQSKEQENGKPDLDKSFRVRQVDSPLFMDEKLNWLDEVKIRNVVWQEIIQKLSLNKEERGKNRGRISYANLGINQLGSVYESLLSYRGFYTEQEYIEVHEPKSPEETYLVPRSRRDDFKKKEILHDEQDEIKIIPEGEFVYRLSGRDRQKSASYYTPESLTRLTVKYALKNILDKVKEGEMKALDLLDLKLLEPAMGAAAFHNEMINQVAEAYLTHRQEELNKRVAPDQYREELQKVKAYIATHNVYGVDINPTAIELGKLSLWLNCIHQDMETPFFANRIACGNATVGAWLKAYKVNEFSLEKDKSGKTVKKEWWEDAPKDLSFGKNGIKRSENEIFHFLLPDKNMLASSDIEIIKDEHEKEVKRSRDWLKEFCRPFRKSELKRLKQISEAIDQELENYYTFLQQLNRKTQSRYNVFGGGKDREQMEMELRSYNEKEKLAEQRLRYDAAYYKIKLVMDYWCSLWFWDARDAVELPSRQQYLNDLEQILAVDDISDKPNGFRHQQKLLNHTGEQLNFDDMVEEDEKATSEIIDQVNRSDFFDNNERLKLVQQLSNKYKFFHPQLEFLEVFWERNGFDLICGNPPWVSISFDGKGVLSEKYPEAVMRSWTVSKVKKKSKEIFPKDQQYKTKYLNEELHAENIKNFLGAKQTYPLLEGHRNNLYKSILENSFTLVGQNGFSALLHPEGVFDDPKGQVLRKGLLKRLRYHFQFVNEKNLFSEVDHHKEFSANIYAGNGGQLGFYSINNLFHPSTVDGCFVHSGKGKCGGYKVIDEKSGDMDWNTNPHAERIIEIGEYELKTISRVFEHSGSWENTILVKIHNKQTLSVIEKLGELNSKVGRKKNKITDCWNETTARNKGIIKKQTFWPNIDNYELIYNGPFFYVGNPLYKTSRKKCTHNSHYDELDLQSLPSDFVPRTRFTPDEDIEEYRNRVSGVSEDTLWIDKYRLGFSKMLNLTAKRTLQSAILPPKVAHTYSIMSIDLINLEDIIELSALTSSIVLDFYVRSIGRDNLNDDTIKGMPIGVDDKYLSPLKSRILMLNCLTEFYSEIWNKAFDDEFTEHTWSKNDKRLLSFSSLHEEWSYDNALRNRFERRQALIEIDVITAMAIGLTLEELILIYEAVFPITIEYELDTWYDQKGNIVFTNNRGLSGVGVDRSTWNSISDFKEGETYVHTVDPSKNELYGGKEVTFYAPFDRCDRVEDYKKAWDHFEKVFAEA